MRRSLNLQLSLTEILLVHVRARIRIHGMTQKGPFDVIGLISSSSNSCVNQPIASL